MLWLQYRTACTIVSDNSVLYLLCLTSMSAHCTGVEFKFDQGMYEVQPQSTLNISVQLITTLQLERDINLTVKILELTAKAGRDFKTPHHKLWFVFNETVRTVQLKIQILSPASNLAFAIYTEEGQYFNTTSSTIYIAEKGNTCAYMNHCY